MDNKDLNEVTPNNEIKNIEPKVEESVKVVSENVPQVENAEIAHLEPEVEVKAEEVTSIEGTQKTTEVPVNVEVQSVEMVPSENTNNVEKKIEETTEDKPREVRIINNEIELIIDEPKKEEEKVEEVVAPVEGKRLLPFIKNDDLFLLISAIILLVLLLPEFPLMLQLLLRLLLPLHQLFSADLLSSLLQRLQLQFSNQQLMLLYNRLNLPELLQLLLPLHCNLQDLQLLLYQLL